MSLDATRTPRQWTTPREKLKLVLDRRKSLILKREDARRYRSACMRLSYLAQDGWDFAEPRSIWPENVWTSWIRVHSTETCTAISRWEAQSCVVISKTRTRWQNPILRGQLLRWRSSSRNSTAGLVAQIGKHTVISGSTLPSLTALSVGDAEF